MSDVFSDLFKARKDRIAFKILLVFGSLVLLGAIVGDKSPKAPAPTWTVEQCMRETFALAKRGGLYNQYDTMFLAGLKQTCEEMVAR